MEEIVVLLESVKFKQKIKRLDYSFLSKKYRDFVAEFSSIRAKLIELQKKIPNLLDKNNTLQLLIDRAEKELSNLQGVLEEKAIKRGFSVRFKQHTETIGFMVMHWPNVPTEQILAKIKPFLEKRNLASILSRKALQENLYLLLQILAKFTKENIADLSHALEVGESVYCWERGVISPLQKTSFEDLKYIYFRIDETICDLTKEQVVECLSIYSPNPPQWFLNFPVFMQNYLLQKWENLKQIFDSDGISENLIAKFNYEFTTAPYDLFSFYEKSICFKHIFEIYSKVTGEKVLDSVRIYYLMKGELKEKSCTIQIYSDGQTKSLPPEHFIVDEIEQMRIGAYKADKAIVRIFNAYKDAVLKYWILYNQLPPSQDLGKGGEKRRKFTEMFVDFFVSYYYEILAEERLVEIFAPEMVRKILPSDLVSKINELEPRLFVGSNILKSLAAVNLGSANWHGLLRMIVKACLIVGVAAIVIAGPLAGVVMAAIIAALIIIENTQATTAIVKNKMSEIEGKEYNISKGQKS
jgi:hypothetical protein